MVVYSKVNMSSCACSAFMLVGVHFDGCSVGDVAKKHTGPVCPSALQIAVAYHSKCAGME